MSVAANMALLDSYNLSIAELELFLEPPTIGVSGRRSGGLTGPGRQGTEPIAVAGFAHRCR
jgi:hypothetical protein